MDFTPDEKSHGLSEETWSPEHKSRGFAFKMDHMSKLKAILCMDCKAQWSK